MKFTKEEKKLCKQVAKKYRKEIEYGDWYYTTEYPEEKYRARIYKYRWTGMADRAINKRKEIIPLWTISDCLEFLNKRGVAIENLLQPGWKNWSILIKHVSVLHIKDAKWTGKELEIRSNKTPLEACLKAVLAVLGENK